MAINYNKLESQEMLRRSYDDQAKAIRSVSTPSSLIMQIYEDSGNTYVCNANPDTALTAAEWMITKFDSDGNSRKCDGDSKFDNVATSAAIVAALTYK